MTRFHPSFTCLLFHATSFERQDCTPEVPVRLLRYPLGQLGRQVEAFSLANDLQGTAQKKHSGVFGRNRTSFQRELTLVLKSSSHRPEERG
jgi:hypothetical protein